MARVTWTVALRNVRAGHDGPVEVRDMDAAPDGRIICTVPGHLVRHRSDGYAVSLLDEDDVATVRLILAAPRMRQILEVLRIWHARMGDWRPAIWEEAEALLDELAGECRAQHGAER
ncbi:MAG TPA: hypothetical protein VJY39_21240 [Acidisphaera sp.]|nr:hypothetical protein [Acidisphaera sp.]HME24825.1 hypothetical protein [Acetobacteraceae bacterium]